MIELGANRYGKAEIRLVRVDRDREPHRVRDLTVGVALEGDFERSYMAADNSLVVATDTMKNTVYALARDRFGGSGEAFGRVLAEHFLGFPQVSRATISIAEHPWEPCGAAVGVPDAFARSGRYTRTAEVIGDRQGGLTVWTGVRDLVLMKSGRSSFSGFPRDRFTTLSEVEDRILASRITAWWRYEGAPEEGDLDAEFASILGRLTDVFAAHDSPSVQTTIWIIGQAVLESHPGVAEVRLSMPNLHHWLVDLGPFGLDNPGLIYVAPSEPYGLIEATVRRRE